MIKQMKQAKWILFSLGLTLIFCVSFVKFYTQRQVDPQSPTNEVETKLEKVLPNAKLVDLDSELLSDDKLRKGKVIHVFVTPECAACLTESEFLSGVIKKRTDIAFYGVTSFGKPKETLELSEKKFPFKTYFDADSLLGIQLKITKVPIKIYVEDGIIKKVWGGATIKEEKQSEFINWLESV